MLEIRGLRKAYQGHKVLDGIDLRVDSGECVALLGYNGSGKSTTLRAIAGLVLPDAGDIRVGGIDALREGKRARAKLSFLSQRPLFPATLTAREALGVIARLRGLPPARVMEELAACELLPVADRDIANLSGGERQRLGLAAALLPDTGLYLFDEPSASLDERAIALFNRRVAGLRDAGKAVLFTTHVAADVHRLATRVVRLRDGRIDADSAPDAAVQLVLAGHPAPARDRELEEEPS